MIRLLMAAALVACSGSALAQVTVSGVKYEESVEVRGAKLHLNGAGIRYRGPFKVSAAGLYLPRKAASPEEAVALSGAKRMSVTLLREVDTEELGRVLTRGVESNTDRAALSKLIPGLIRMSQIFSDHKRLGSGDSFYIDWIPGTGTIVSVRGVPQGEPFKEPEFFNALLMIWLGPNPADARLKDALLGRVSQS